MDQYMSQEHTEVLDNNEISLLETLDHVLNRGLVVTGDITISVADIDLIYLGLNLVLASVDTINRALGGRDNRKEPGEGDGASNGSFFGNGPGPD
jgi:hypothetical protein